MLVFTLTSSAGSFVDREDRKKIRAGEKTVTLSNVEEKSLPSLSDNTVTRNLKVRTDEERHVAYRRFVFILSTMLLLNENSGAGCNGNRETHYSLLHLPILNLAGSLRKFRLLFFSPCRKKSRVVVVMLHLHRFSLQLLYLLIGIHCDNKINMTSE